jgi:hypothetical protein
MLETRYPCFFSTFIGRLSRLHLSKPVQSGKDAGNNSSEMEGAHHLRLQACILIRATRLKENTG